MNISKPIPPAPAAAPIATATANLISNRRNVQEKYGELSDIFSELIHTFKELSDISLELMLILKESINISPSLNTKTKAPIKM